MLFTKEIGGLGDQRKCILITRRFIKKQKSNTYPAASKVREKMLVSEQTLNRRSQGLGHMLKTHFTTSHQGPLCKLSKVLCLNFLPT